ncbi:Discoidin, CUB and LCCL domain-containing protein 2 [Bagarius yarrelli]|uniref:Discoidin, CUB and LCCL domain-containing protein 2 n=1 Tax=Bagarius yarrelli TaxID=175774 RepID=A0A556VD51_BAGYA|nr:Discoidin, CUB and LCCL domain-containing protein 2 [Bagarius yarrelli]
MIFYKDLFNKSSPAYKALEQKFLELLVPYLQSNLSNVQNLEILNFRNGSIVVNSRITFWKPVPQGISTVVCLILENFCDTAYQTMNMAIDKYSLDVESGDQADLCKYQACNKYAECAVNRWSSEAECVCKPGYFNFNGLPCQSICDIQLEFCLNNGKCEIISGRGAICRCQVGDNWWYRGERCEEYVSVLIIVGIATVSVAGFLLVASGVIFFLARALKNQHEEEAQDIVRNGDSVASLKMATKYNPMYESDVMTGYSHYYQHYPIPVIYSSTSVDTPTDLSSNEIQHIYENMRRQTTKVRISAVGNTITLKFLQLDKDTKLGGYILGYGSSLFSKQLIKLPEDGKPYETEIDAEPKYLVAVQPVKEEVKKQCTGKETLEKPLHLVIGSVTPTSVMLSWGTLLNALSSETNLDDCIEDGALSLSLPGNVRPYLVDNYFSEQSQFTESLHRALQGERAPKDLDYQTCPSRETVVDQLKPDTPYEFGVRAESENINGAWSPLVIHNTAVKEIDTYTPEKPENILKPITESTQTSIPSVSVLHSLTQSTPASLLRRLEPPPKQKATQGTGSDGLRTAHPSEESLFLTQTLTTTHGSLSNLKSTNIFQTHYSTKPTLLVTTQQLYNSIQSQTVSSKVKAKLKVTQKERNKISNNFSARGIQEKTATFSFRTFQPKTRPQKPYTIHPKKSINQSLHSTIKSTHKNTHIRFTTVQPTAIQSQPYAAQPQSFIGQSQLDITKVITSQTPSNTIQLKFITTQFPLHTLQLKSMTTQSPTNPSELKSITTQSPTHTSQLKCITTQTQFYNTHPKPSERQSPCYTTKSQINKAKFSTSTDQPQPQPTTILFQPLTAQTQSAGTQTQPHTKQSQPNRNQPKLKKPHHITNRHTTKARTKPMQPKLTTKIKQPKHKPQQSYTLQPQSILTQTSTAKSQDNFGSHQQPVMNQQQNYVTKLKFTPNVYYHFSTLLEPLSTSEFEQQPKYYSTSATVKLSNIKSWQRGTTELTLKSLPMQPSETPPKKSNTQNSPWGEKKPVNKKIPVGQMGQELTSPSTSVASTSTSTITKHASTVSVPKPIDLPPTYLNSSVKNPQGTRFNIGDNSVFSSVPISDLDPMGKKRFVAPHVVYQIDKPPEQPCSVTHSLSFFTDEDNNVTNITGPPRTPPTNLTVITVEGCSSFVILDWETADNETTEYEITSSVKSPNGHVVSVVKTNQTHTAVENLKPQSSYEFIVTPKNDLGSGPSSESVSFSTESGKNAIWSSFTFNADSYTECTGTQYVKRTWYRKFVGIQLCNSLRYKIYLSDSLKGKFYDIGDETGYGEDHCQFVDSFLDGRTGGLLPPHQLPPKQGDGCGHTVLGAGSGSLASLGYPIFYPADSVCEWEISGSNGETLLLQVADLYINTHNCQVSYLRLFDVKFCHGDVSSPRKVKSSGHQVTVQFMSGPHSLGRGFFLSYTSSQQPDLISCLEKGNDFTEAEFSKFCPAGCLTEFGEVSGTIPHGYRDSSSLCLAGIHAGVVSNTLGGHVSVVSSTGIPHYDGTLANNVTSVGGNLSPSLFTFRTSGCYGTLGMESGVISDYQISVSSVWEWARHGKKTSPWAPSGARLKKTGLPWAAADSNSKQWIHVDLKKEKRVTGIITTGSTLSDYQFYVSAYRVHYSSNGQDWTAYQETGSNQDKDFQGNIDYFHEVRNNFIPPIEARYVRVTPVQWHQRIALKMELLGCQISAVSPRMYNPLPPPKTNHTMPSLEEQTTYTPNIRNITVAPHSHDVRWCRSSHVLLFQKGRWCPC